MMKVLSAHLVSLFAITGGFIVSTAVADLQQDSYQLIVGEHMVIAYSGFREGQHPDSLA